MNFQSIPYSKNLAKNINLDKNTVHVTYVDGMLHFSKTNIIFCKNDNYI